MQLDAEEDGAHSFYKPPPASRAAPTTGDSTAKPNDTVPRAEVTATDVALEQDA